jgi:hypothetical protein
MNPRFYHYWGAHLTPIVCQTGGVVLVSVVSVACADLFTGSSGLLPVLEGMLAIAASYPLGALLGILVLGRLFYPLVSWLAGAPFAIGDKVMILRGPRKRKVAEVYEVWESRGQVRLSLSQEESDGVADVFSENEVFRIKEPNRPPQGTPGSRSASTAAPWTPTPLS